MNSYNLSVKDQKKAENIRGNYMDKKASKLEQLRQLDNKVKRPATMVTAIVGIIGVFLLGAGMSEIMAFGNMNFGLLLGIPGLVILVLTIPIYKIFLNSRKKKYATQVLQLSDEIIN